MNLRLIPLLLFFLLPAGGLAGEKKVPPIREVFKEALKYAGLEAGNISRWERKARKAPLLPRLQFGFDRRFRNNLNIDVKDSVAVNSSGVTVGPTQQARELDSDSDLNFEIKAIWYLDQLLFSGEDLDISGEARMLSRERERLLTQVRKYYFLRGGEARELSQLKKTGASSSKRALKELEIAEITAALDALTGGWFGEQLGEAP